MAASNLFHTFWSFLCTIIALFYIFRLVGARAQIHPFDVENEVGHGMMAVGMAFMLAPLGLLTPGLVLWNIILCSIASLWFTGRLLARKPLLALLSGKNRGPSALQSDAIHVFTYVGMCYMFLLMSSMTFSMTRTAVDINYTFCFSFAFLTLFYIREISKDLQTTRLDRLKLGADIAHTLMSGAMAGMFIEMISMAMSMSRP